MTPKPLPRGAVAVRFRRPLLAAAGLTLLWHLVLFAAAFGLPPLGTNLGPTVVNVLAGLVPLSLVLAAGWDREAWFATLRPRRAWLLLPVGLVSMSYALPGIDGTPVALLASAGLFAVLGASEELLSRGVVQRLLDGFPPLPRTVWVGIIFGMGHVLSAAAFGRPAGDAAVQVVSAATFGFGFAALRMHVVSIWPLAALHGLDDWLQVNSPGAAPWWWQPLVAVGFVGYGRWLVAATKSSRIDSSKCDVTGTDQLSAFYGAVLKRAHNKLAPYVPCEPRAIRIGDGS